MTKPVLSMENILIKFNISEFYFQQFKMKNYLNLYEQRPFIILKDIPTNITMCILNTHIVVRIRFADARF